MRTVNEVNGTLDFLVPPNLGYEDRPVDNPKTARRARLNPAMMDAAFVREPSQCDEPTCSQMKQVYEYKNMQSMKAAGNYKYVLDVSNFSLLKPHPLDEFPRLMVTVGLVVSNV